jgi:hypothetical protein
MNSNSTLGSTGDRIRRSQPDGSRDTFCWPLRKNDDTRLPLRARQPRNTTIVPYPPAAFLPLAEATRRASLRSWQFVVPSPVMAISAYSSKATF